MSRSTPYAAELVRAEFAECRIERIFVRDTLTEAIRFSDWRGGRFNPRALEIDEGELLVLLGDAIAARVFSAAFLDEMQHIQTRAIMATKSDTGRTTYPKIGIWYAEDDGHIRMSIEGQGLTSVSNDPKSERYHRTLYKKLAGVLEQAGLPVPASSEEDA